MTRTVDQFGRTRIILSSDLHPGKTIELSEKTWERVSYPITVEEAFRRMADQIIEEAPVRDPLLLAMAGQK